MKIDYIMPYSTSLEIGKVYTEAIRQCKEWVCLMDQDTLRPPGFAERIEKVIKEHGNKERLFGCMTNRVGWDHPAIVKEMFQEDSITVHLEVAKAIWREHKTGVMKTNVVPGYCMVFHRDLAERWLPFPDETVTFDRIASRLSDCYIMKGVYIIHLYRWGANKEPHRKVEHLKTPKYWLK